MRQWLSNIKWIPLTKVTFWSVVGIAWSGSISPLTNVCFRTDMYEEEVPLTWKLSAMGIYTEGILWLNIIACRIRLHDVMINRECIISIGNSECIQWVCMYVYSAQHKPHFLYCIAYTALCTMNCIHCTVDTALSALHCLYCAVYTDLHIHWTMYTVLYTLYTLRIVHRAVYTQHNKGCSS